MFLQLKTVFPQLGLGKDGKCVMEWMFRVVVNGVKNGKNFFCGKTKEGNTFVFWIKRR